MFGYCRVLEQELVAGESRFDSSDQAALLQLLSQAEKDSWVIDSQVTDSDKDRQSVLESRLMAGPLTSSHLGVLQLLGRAEVCLF
jgi:hypothetical protein